MSSPTDDEAWADAQLLFSDFIRKEEEPEYISYGDKIKLWVAPQVRMVVQGLCFIGLEVFTYSTGRQR